MFGDVEKDDKLEGMVQYVLLVGKCVENDDKCS